MVSTDFVSLTVDTATSFTRGDSFPFAGAFNSAGKGAGGRNKKRGDGEGGEGEGGGGIMSCMAVVV